jgi:hypothetical protein
MPRQAAMALPAGWAEESPGTACLARWPESGYGSLLYIIVDQLPPSTGCRAHALPDPLRLPAGGAAPRAMAWPPLFPFRRSINKMKAPHPTHRPQPGRTAGLAALLLWLLVFAPLAGGATRVLYLGDSFSKGAFGRNLDAQMRAAGLEVYTSVTGGASAYDWLPEFGATSTNIGYWEKTPKKEFRVTHLSRVPKINEMVERWRPNVVVIQGGTNMYSVLTSKRRPKAQNIAELERLLNRIGQIVSSSGARLYWITPASAHPKRFSSELQAEMRAILTRVADRYGRTFDSYAVTRFTDPYPGTDGIHYGPNEATAWSRLVAKDLIYYSDRLGGGRRAFASSTGPAEPRASATATRGRGFWDIFRRNRASAPSPASPPAEPERRPASLPPGPSADPADSPSVTIRRAEDTPPGPSPEPARQEPALQVEVVLRQKSMIGNLGEVTYRSALGVFEYEVMAVPQGTYAAKTIRIAHLIVMNNQYTSINQRPLGSRMTLEVERLSKYPNLEKIQMVDDLEPAYDLDVFVPKL